MFYLIGLGLGDFEDITVKGLRIVKASKRVYLEVYTSILSVSVQELEEFYGRKLILADREMVEQRSDEILAEADVEDIACLVVGDPFGATTHADLLSRAQEKGIKCEVVHNASILTAIGVCGLQLYSFGETVSVVFWTEDWKPESFCDKIIENRKRGLHTLCLLDIKVKEQTIENMMRGRKIYEPPRYMTVSQALTQFLQVIRRRREESKDESSSADNSTACSQCPWLTEETLCVGLARIGNQTQKICAGSVQELSNVDLGPPLHSLVIVGRMHPIEQEYLQQFAVNPETFNNSSTFPSIADDHAGQCDHAT